MLTYAGFLLRYYYFFFGIFLPASSDSYWSLIYLRQQPWNKLDNRLWTKKKCCWEHYTKDMLSRRCNNAYSQRRLLFVCCTSKWEWAIVINYTLYSYRCVQLYKQYKQFLFVFISGGLLLQNVRFVMARFII